VREVASSVRKRGRSLETIAKAQKEGTISTVEKPDNNHESFTPNIIAFACHYCAFAAADLAGVMRLTYPTEVKVIRIPCTGKLDHVYVLRAFEQGIDGVFVAGCLVGQCHFLEGNTNAAKRVKHIKKLLENVDIDPVRLEMYNLSGAQGTRWAEICIEFTERIRMLGPSPIRLAKKKKGGTQRCDSQ
jgi:F420-non-reducing hydrogenase iron-sulfur subunit